jgi:hypothetical protein
MASNESSELFKAILGLPGVRQAFTDQAQLQRSTVDMVLHWVMVEHHLADLLSAAIDRPGEHIGHVIYSAPSATETRIDIVDAAMVQLAFEGRISKLTLAVWSRIECKLGQLKKVRNRVVHGQIVGVSRSGKSYGRLVDPVFDHIRSRSNRTEGQLPGMSATDVRQSVNAISKYNSIIMKIVEAVRLERNEPTNGIWQEKVRELATELKIEFDSDTGDPIPKARKAPPERSQA